MSFFNETFDSIVTTVHRSQALVVITGEIPCMAGNRDKFAHMQAIHSTYTAGMVSEAARIPVSTLRRWCSSGRTGIRSRTRLWRRFSVVEALRIAAIADLTRRGFEVRQAARALAGADEQLQRVIAGESTIAVLKVGRGDLQLAVDLSRTWRTVAATLRAFEKAPHA
jgi:DNA-binding transcriptional MerR regulator